MNKLQAALRQLEMDCKRFWLPVMIALLYLLVSEYFFHTPCPVAIIFHFPCPGCGMTRACMELLQFHFLAAFHYNAMIFLWVPLVIYFAIFRYFYQEEPPLFLPISIGIAILTILYYLSRLLSGSLFTLLP